MFIIDVSGAMDAKRSGMGGRSHADGVVDICAGFPAKTKGAIQEVITFPLSAKKRFYFVGEEGREHSRSYRLGLFGNVPHTGVG